MNVPPLVPAKTGPQGFRASQCASPMEGHYLGLCDSYLIDRKSNGQESRPLLALHPSAFLHQSHDKSARPAPVLRVVVLLEQLQPVLRVGPECVCKTQGRALETKASHRDIQSPVRYGCCHDAGRRVHVPPGKFLQPPAELPLTQRPWLTDTVQLFLSLPCRASGVRLHSSNFVKLLLKFSKDILWGKVSEDNR